MKPIKVIITFMASASCANYDYFKRVDSCKNAIVELRDNESRWDKVCFNERRDQNYLCNNAPPAPEIKSTDPKYDKEAGDAYIAWALEENDNYRNKYDEYCGVD